MPELTRIETVVFLQRLDLFAHCTAHQILRISAIVQQQQVMAGAEIYARGAPATQLHCVVDGAVGLRDAADQRLEIGAGQTFGVKEILSGRLRATDAVARQDTHLLTIDARDFFDLLADNIEIVKALFRRLLHDPQAPTLP